MIRFPSILLMLALILPGCGTDSSPVASDTPAVSQPNPANDVQVSVNGNVVPEAPVQDSAQPRLTLMLTDAPLDSVVKVVIRLLAVELKGGDPGQTTLFTFNTPRDIDLLSLQGVQTETLLSEFPVAVGVYNEIRLLVDDSSLNSFVELDDGSVHDLKIPSGSSSGLKVKGDIVALATQSLSYTIDFDVLKSVVQAGASGKYLLKPVLRLIENPTAGHIRGSVDSTLLTASSCSDSDPATHNAVYVFAGSNVVPSDVDSSEIDGVEPVTTALIELDPESGDYVFEAAFLPAGEYTLSFTCNLDSEDPETANELLFFNTQNVTVQLNNILFL